MSRLSDPQQRFIRNRYDQFRHVPRRGVFVANCVPLKPSVIRDAEQKGIVEEVDTVDSAQGNGNDIYVWTLTEPAREYIEGYDPLLEGMMPCTHTNGFTNEYDSKNLVCNECGGRFTVQEVTEFRDEYEDELAQKRSTEDT